MTKLKQYLKAILLYILRILDEGELKAAAYPKIEPKVWPMDDPTITSALCDVEDAIYDACGVDYNTLNIDSIGLLQEAVVALKLAIFKIKARS